MHLKMSSPKYPPFSFRLGVSTSIDGAEIQIYLPRAPYLNHLWDGLGIKRKNVRAKLQLVQSNAQNKHRTNHRSYFDRTKLWLVDSPHKSLGIRKAFPLNGVFSPNLFSLGEMRLENSLVNSCLICKEPTELSRSERREGILVFCWMEVHNRAQSDSLGYQLTWLMTQLGRATSFSWNSVIEGLY